MIIIQSGHPFLVNAAPSWSVDWAWGLPLIVLTVLYSGPRNSDHPIS